MESYLGNSKAYYQGIPPPGKSYENTPHTPVTGAGSTSSAYYQYGLPVPTPTTVTSRTSSLSSSCTSSSSSASSSRYPPYSTPSVLSFPHYSGDGLPYHLQSSRHSSSQPNQNSLNPYSLGSHNPFQHSYAPAHSRPPDINRNKINEQRPPVTRSLEVTRVGPPHTFSSISPTECSQTITSRPNTAHSMVSSSHKSDYRLPPDLHYSPQRQTQSVLPPSQKSSSHVASSRYSSSFSSSKGTPHNPPTLIKAEEPTTLSAAHFHQEQHHSHAKVGGNSSSSNKRFETATAPVPYALAQRSDDSFFAEKLEESYACIKRVENPYAVNKVSSDSSSSSRPISGEVEIRKQRNEAYYLKNYNPTDYSYMNGVRENRLGNSSNSSFKDPPKETVGDQSKTDLVLDLSVKTVRQTADSTAPETDYNTNMYRSSSSRGSLTSSPRSSTPYSYSQEKFHHQSQSGDSSSSHSKFPRMTPPQFAQLTSQDHNGMPSHSRHPNLKRPSDTPSWEHLSKAPKLDPSVSYKSKSPYPIYPSSYDRDTAKVPVRFENTVDSQVESSNTAVKREPSYTASVDYSSQNDSRVQSDSYKNWPPYFKTKSPTPIGSKSSRSLVQSEHEGKPHFLPGHDFKKSLDSRYAYPYTVSEASYPSQSSQYYHNMDYGGNPSYLHTSISEKSLHTDHFKSVSSLTSQDSSRKIKQFYNSPEKISEIRIKTETELNSSVIPHSSSASQLSDTPYYQASSSGLNTNHWKNEHKLSESDPYVASLNKASESISENFKKAIDFTQLDKRLTMLSKNEAKDSVNKNSSERDPSCFQLSAHHSSSSVNDKNESSQLSSTSESCWPTKESSSSSENPNNNKPETSVNNSVSTQKRLSELASSQMLKAVSETIDKELRNVTLEELKSSSKEKEKLSVKDSQLTLDKKGECKKNFLSEDSQRFHELNLAAKDDVSSEKKVLSQNQSDVKPGDAQKINEVQKVAEKILVEKIDSKIENIEKVREKEPEEIPQLKDVEPLEIVSSSVSEQQLESEIDKTAKEKSSSTNSTLNQFDTPEKAIKSAVDKSLPDITSPSEQKSEFNIETSKVSKLEEGDNKTVLSRTDVDKENQNNVSEMQSEKDENNDVKSVKKLPEIGKMGNENSGLGKIEMEKKFNVSVEIESSLVKNESKIDIHQKEIDEPKHSIDIKLLKDDNSTKDSKSEIEKVTKDGNNAIKVEEMQHVSHVAGNKSDSDKNSVINDNKVNNALKEVKQNEQVPKESILKNFNDNSNSDKPTENVKCHENSSPNSFKERILKKVEEGKKEEEKQIKTLNEELERSKTLDKGDFKNLNTINDEKSVSSCVDANSVCDKKEILVSNEKPKSSLEENNLHCNVVESKKCSPSAELIDSDNQVSNANSSQSKKEMKCLKEKVLPETVKNSGSEPACKQPINEVKSTSPSYKDEVLDFSQSRKENCNVHTSKNDFNRTFEVVDAPKSALMLAHSKIQPYSDSIGSHVELAIEKKLNPNFVPSSSYTMTKIQNELLPPPLKHNKANPSHLPVLTSHPETTSPSKSPFSKRPHSVPSSSNHAFPPLSHSAPPHPNSQYSLPSDKSIPLTSKPNNNNNKNNNNNEFLLETKDYSQSSSNSTRFQPHDKTKDYSQSSSNSTRFQPHDETKDLKNLDSNTSSSHTSHLNQPTSTSSPVPVYHLPIQKHVSDNTPFSMYNDPKLFAQFSKGQHKEFMYHKEPNESFKSDSAYSNKKYHDSLHRNYPQTSQSHPADFSPYKQQKKEFSVSDTISSSYHNPSRYSSNVSSTSKSIATPYSSFSPYSTHHSLHYTSSSNSESLSKTSSVPGTPICHPSPFHSSVSPFSSVGLYSSLNQTHSSETIASSFSKDPLMKNQNPYTDKQFHKSFTHDERKSPFANPGSKSCNMNVAYPASMTPNSSPRGSHSTTPHSTAPSPCSSRNSSPHFAKYPSPYSKEAYPQVSDSSLSSLDTCAPMNLSSQQQKKSSSEPKQSYSFQSPNSTQTKSVGPGHYPITSSPVNYTSKASYVKGQIPVSSQSLLTKTTSHSKSPVPRLSKSPIHSSKSPLSGSPYPPKSTSYYPGAIPDSRSGSFEAAYPYSQHPSYYYSDYNQKLNQTHDYISSSGGYEPRKSESFSYKKDETDKTAKHNIPSSGPVNSNSYSNATQYYSNSLKASTQSPFPISEDSSLNKGIYTNNSSTHKSSYGSYEPPYYTSASGTYLHSTHSSKIPSSQGSSLHKDSFSSTSVHQNSLQDTPPTVSSVNHGKYSQLLPTKYSYPTTTESHHEPSGPYHSSPYYPPSSNHSFYGYPSHSSSDSTPKLQSSNSSADLVTRQPSSSASQFSAALPSSSYVHSPLNTKHSSSNQASSISHTHPQSHYPTPPASHHPPPSNHPLPSQSSNLYPSHPPSNNLPSVSSSRHPQSLNSDHPPTSHYTKLSSHQQIPHTPNNDLAPYPTYSLPSSSHPTPASKYSNSSNRHTVPPPSNHHYSSQSVSHTSLSGHHPPTPLASHYPQTSSHFQAASTRHPSGPQPSSSHHTSAPPPPSHHPPTPRHHPPAPSRYHSPATVPPPPPSHHPSATLPPPPPSRHSSTAPPPSGHRSSATNPPSHHPSSSLPPPSHQPSPVAPTSHHHSSAPPLGHHHSTAPLSHHHSTGPPSPSHHHSAAHLPPPSHHHSNAPPPPSHHSTAPLPSHHHSSAPPPLSHHHSSAPPNLSHHHSTAPPPLSHHNSNVLQGHHHSPASALPPLSHHHSVSAALPPPSHSSSAPPPSHHPSASLPPPPPSHHTLTSLPSSSHYPSVSIPSSHHSSVPPLSSHHSTPHPPPSHHSAPPFNRHPSVAPPPSHHPPTAPTSKHSLTSNQHLSNTLTHSYSSHQHSLNHQNVFPGQHPPGNFESLQSRPPISYQHPPQNNDKCSLSNQTSSLSSVKPYNSAQSYRYPSGSYTNLYPSPYPNHPPCHPSQPPPSHSSISESTTATTTTTTTTTTVTISSNKSALSNKEAQNYTRPPISHVDTDTSYPSNSKQHPKILCNQVPQCNSSQSHASKQYSPLLPSVSKSLSTHPNSSLNSPHNLVQISDNSNTDVKVKISDSNNGQLTKINEQTVSSDCVKVLETGDSDKPADESSEASKSTLTDKVLKKPAKPCDDKTLVSTTDEGKPTVTEEEDLNFKFDKLMDDLGSHKDSVVSKKSRILGRRYNQKVQLQHAVDNNEVIVPETYLEEEDEESEREEPVKKFRGKFRSIKDKAVERLILTYASHSDESATEMIPDEDASDFEEELIKEIEAKARKGKVRGKGVKLRDSSTESKEKDHFARKKTAKDSKQNKDDDFSPSSSFNSSSSSDDDSNSSDSSASSSSSSSSSSELNDSLRRRRGVVRKRRHNCRTQSSSNSDEEFLPPKRRTRSKKQSSDEDDDDDDNFIPTKSKGKRSVRRSSFRGKRKLRKRQREGCKFDNDEEEENDRDKIFSARNKDKRKLKRERVLENSDTDEENSPQSRIIDSNKRKKGGVLKLKIVKSNTNLSSSDSDKDEPKKKLKLISDSDEGFAPSKIKSLKSKILDSESDLESHLETPIDISPQKAVDEELCSTVDTKEKQNENEKLTYLSDKELLFNNNEDSVLIKLNKIRLDELNREDVQEMTLWKNTASTEMKKLLEELPETKWRHSWRKPQFGSDEFKKGWQAEVKKFKIEVARIPSRLVSTPSPPSNIPTQGEKSSCGNQKKSKDNLKKGKQKSVPLKNTRSKAGIVKTSLSEIDKSAFKVAARPEISNVMERFFEKVLGEGPPSVESCKKFPAFEPFRPSSRSPTGLTPTPSLALSLIASDDSDRDSIASLRTDLPASDSVPVAPRRRSIANTLFKRLHKKNKENKLDLQWLNKSRGIMKSTNKPCLLPTPGLSLKDTDAKTPTNYDQLRLSTFFRKDSVSRYRETFDDIVFKNGINEFIPVLVPSRTRNKSKALLDAATIKAVFGADSSSIVLPSKQTSNNSSNKSKITNSNKKYPQPDVKRKDLKEITFSNNSHTQSPIPSSISQSSTPVHFLFNDNDDDDSEIRSERSETTVQELVIMQGIRKSRKKLRKFRKFRSGFDYIRKKKKTKTEEELLQTVKKRMPVRKRMIWPEENKDIANEIKGWVINKGLGETVLHKAARLQYHDVVIYCLESSDFNVNAKDNAGYTPLHEACNRGHLDIAQALCAHHAHVNASGFGGMRPLHEAIENGHIELARLLLAYGADPSLSTYGGQSCLALASDPQTERFVVEYLADLKAKKEQPWHFLGPSKIFDLTEQGCDVFANTPQSREMKLLTFPSSVEESSHKDTKIKEENSPDTKIKEEPGKEIKVKEEPCSSEQNPDKTQNEDELLLPKITFEYSEREIPTTYMVVDRDGTYFLMRDLLERLSMTRNELIVAVGSVETLHLSAEDCDKKVKCMVLGSIPPSRKRESRGSVTFVKYSDTIRELLGIEVCVLK